MNSNSWIECDDKLPERDDEYLVCGAYPSREPIIVVAAFWAGQWISSAIHSSFYGYITHWMPLPEVPAVSVYEQWKRDPSIARPYEEFRAEMGLT